MYTQGPILSHIPPVPADIPQNGIEVGNLLTLPPGLPLVLLAAPLAS